MYKMASQIETIVNTYKTLTKIPSVSEGKLNRAGRQVSAKWLVRNLDKGKSTKYTTSYTLDDNLNVIGQSEFGSDVTNELLSAVSPKDTYKAIIREEKNSKDVKKQYLEVWKRSTLAHCIDLTALDLHGDVYADSEFGSLDWNQDETKIVYVAEKNLPKFEPYIKRKGDSKPKCDECGAGDPVPRKGEEFVYRQDWGEQLVGKHASVVVVCSVQDEAITVLDRLPPGLCPGQVRFAPDGASVVGVAWDTRPRRLGLIFCTNRPSYIFTLTLDGIMTQLSKEGQAVRSPRYSPDGELVWLQRAAGGPHHACHQLVVRRRDSEEEVPLIDIVETETVTASGAPFYGLYCQALPKNCFTDDGRLVFSTPQRNETRAYVLDLANGRIADLSIAHSPGSTSVLDVRSDVILASYSNLTTPGQLYAARLPPRGEEGDIKWVQVSEPADPSPVAASTVEYLHLEHEEITDDVKSFSAIYFAPKAEEGKKLPLIVWPHGGPHSNFVNAFALETSLFNMLGFAAILINYRGSTGAGQATVAYLPRRVGDADVKDCKLATDVAVRRFNVNERQMVLFGGSHGGFLVTHLSGQYPDVYRALFARNPVTDVATMFNYTDINDCAKSVVGFASVRCNYRGSIGFGDANVRSLIGRVGQYDVADCYLALTNLLERDGTSHVLLFGGSYGGLVVGHLAARYPDAFKAMFMKNPLIDLATKGHYADNSDGCAVEAGFEFTESGAMSESELVAMRRCSPLAHAHLARAPAALALGTGDRRVPHYQGLEYARRLKANGVETRVYIYDDNHSLSSLPAEMDCLINSARWFLSHIDS